MSIEFFASRTVFLHIGPLTIYWYGVLYVIAFWAGWWLLPWLGRMRNVALSRDQSTSIVAFGALGVLVGGRLGYALFYEPLFFLAHPVELLKIWHGGMSSHGGFVGVILFLWLACRRLPVSLSVLADIVSPVVALGLMIGRVGNIINQEFGVYPYYEALGDCIIAILCYVALRRKQPNGIVFGVFLMLYGAQRFLLEYIRPQEWPIIFGLSRGQILTIPILILAVLVLLRAYKRRI